MSNGNAMDRFQGQLQQQQQQQPMPGERMVEQGATMQRVQTQYHTAVSVQVPRSKKDVLKRVLEECEIMPDGLLYSWTVNSKDGSKSVIEGASVRLAMTLAREYGNCFVHAELINEDKRYWTFQGTFVDLETGFTCNRLFRQSKDTVRGKYDVERKLDMAFQIGQSKAIRNTVVNAMPAGILMRAQETAKQALANQLTAGGLQHGIQKMTKAFLKYNVKQEHLETRIGKKTAKFTPEDIADLRAVYSALEDGQTSPAQEFEMTEQNKDNLASGVAGKASGKGKGKGKAKEEKKEAAPEPPPVDPSYADPGEPPEMADEPPIGEPPEDL